MNTEEVIKNMRSTFEEFKRPYLIGPTEKKNNSDKTNPNIQDMSVLERGENEIQNLYNIMKEVITNKGVIPPTADMNKKAVLLVFEKRGVLPALRNDPSLQELLEYYAKLDLYHYPFTISPTHIEEVARNDRNMNAEPNNNIIPNESANMNNDMTN
jgi:hypothetical protein